MQTRAGKLKLGIRRDAQRSLAFTGNTPVPPKWRWPSPAVLLFLFYVAYVHLELGTRIEILGAIRGQMVLGLVLLALALPRMKGKPIPESRAVIGWTWAFILCVFLMCVLSSAPEDSWWMMSERMYAYFLFSVFIVAFIRDINSLRWLIAVFLVVFFRMAVEGFLGWWDGSLVWENQGIPRLHGSTRIYLHPNSFGATQLATIPFLYFYFRGFDWRLRLVMIVQAALAMLVVVSAGSRTTYVGFFGLIAYFWWRSRSKAKSAALIVVLGMAALPLIPPEYIGRFESIFAPADARTNGSKLARMEINSDSRKMFLEHPLGVGVNAYVAVRQEMFGRMQDTHNLYLQVATNLGIQGVVIFTGLVTTLLLSFSRLRRRLEELQAKVGRMRVANPANSAMSKDLWFLTATTNALMGFLLLRLWVGLFGHDLYEIYWWFIIGLVLALHRITSDMEAEVKRAEEGPR